MIEKLKKGFFPISWTINKLSSVTPLAIYIWDYYSDIKLTIDYYQYCQYQIAEYCFLTLIISFLSTWFLRARDSYINKNKGVAIKLWTF